MGQDDEEIINMMGSAEPEILDEAERKEREEHERRKTAHISKTRAVMRGTGSIDVGRGGGRGGGGRGGGRGGGGRGGGRGKISSLPVLPSQMMVFASAASPIHSDNESKEEEDADPTERSSASPTPEDMEDASIEEVGPIDDGEEDITVGEKNAARSESGTTSPIHMHGDDDSEEGAEPPSITSAEEAGNDDSITQFQKKPRRKSKGAQARRSSMLKNRNFEPPEASKVDKPEKSMKMIDAAKDVASKAQENVQPRNQNYEGYMEKKGGGTSFMGRRSWKKRWFVLDSKSIKYYPTREIAYSKPDTFLGEIVLTAERPLQVEDRYVSETRNAVPHFLLTSASGRIYEFRTMDVASHDVWEENIISALRQMAVENE